MSPLAMDLPRRSIGWLSARGWLSSSSAKRTRSIGLPAALARIAASCRAMMATFCAASALAAISSRCSGRIFVIGCSMVGFGDPMEARVGGAGQTGPADGGAL